jgi:hypothetical protein
MPAMQLDANNPSQARRFYVVGTRSEACHSWMGHASLLRADAMLTYNQAAHVYHICPPLQLGPGTRHHNPHVDQPIKIHAIGFVDGFDAEGIETWMQHLSTQTPTLYEGVDRWEQYVMCPPMRHVRRDTTTGVRIFVRFSCVGFVLDCYDHGIDIRLLDWQSDRYPRVCLAELLVPYAFLANPDVRHKVLGGPERWPVPLPGHLFHALRRRPEVIRREPYLPGTTEEAYFPSRPNDPRTAAEESEIQCRAYLYALERGGGQLPTWDEAMAAADYQRAAREVMGGRLPQRQP